MRTFQVDENNNFVIGDDGQIPIIGALPATSQTARQFSQARKGEMIYKGDEGIPYALIAWAADPNEAAFEVSQRARLLQLPTVTAVTAFEIIRVGDDLKYTATLDTTEGELVING
jgi:cyanophycinase-like exopeptidase